MSEFKIGERVRVSPTGRGLETEGVITGMTSGWLIQVKKDDFPGSLTYTLGEVHKLPLPELEDMGELPSHEEQVWDIVDLLTEADKTADDPKVFTVWHHYAEALLKAGYRKVGA